MATRPSAGADNLTGTPKILDLAKSVERRRRSRPTVFGLVLVAVLLVSAVFRPGVADPSVMGLVWAGLAAAVVLGVVFPLISLNLLRIEVVSAPIDLVVGQLASLQVQILGRGSGLMLRCGRSPMFVVDLTSPSEVKLPFEVSERGAYTYIPVEIMTDAPFSILVARQQRVLRLPHQLLVGPEPSAAVANVGPLAGEYLDAVSTGHSTSGDTVRSVRPYVSGDPSHMVHWPTSARTGSLVVREFEPPQTEGVAIVVNLGHGPANAISASTATVTPGSGASATVTATATPASGASAGPDSDARGGAGAGSVGRPSPIDQHGRIEAAAARAGALANDALERGARVMLCTSQTGGPVMEEVATRLDVQRRLALATAGPVGVAPEGWPVEVVVP